jgi:hypothetical protein
MRAIFTVTLPKKNATEYQSDDDFLSFLRSEGLDDPKIMPLKKEKQIENYERSAQKLWEQMPEVAKEEKEYLIFCGFLQDNQTYFLITRRNVGYAKFRLLNPNLDKLQDNTEMLIKGLVRKDSNKNPNYEITNNSIEILEKNENHVIIQGRVITNSWKEAKLKNTKNYLISFTTFLLFLLFLILMFLLKYLDAKDNFFYTTFERLDTVALTTCIVSAFDFWTTYKQIKEHKIVAWTVSTEISKKAKELIK